MRVVCLMLTRRVIVRPLSPCDHHRRRSKIIAPFQFWSSSILLLLLLLQESVLRVRSLPPPTPPCCCSPTAYTFELDFSLSCPPANVVVGSDAGIDRSFCEIDFSIAGAGEGTLIPEVVTNVRIFELALDLTVAGQVELSDLSLGDGGTFELTSVGCGADEDDILGGLQMRVTGVNDLGEEVVNDWIVAYTNLCDVEVFFPQNSLGWVVFDQLSPPRSDFCFSGAETPTVDPTEAPAPTPTGDFTESPTDGSMSYPMSHPYF